MTIITKDALEWVQDELEVRDAVISDLEEELEAALEENAALKIQLSRLMSDRSLAV